MKTKDFIKMLQDEDPTGEGYLRLDGGVPYAVEKKVGYYDGSYSYIDEEGNYVISTKDNKIDVYMKDPEDIIWDEVDLHEEGNRERVLGMFKYDFSCYAYPEQRIEQERRYQQEREKTYEEAYAYEQQKFEKYLTEVLVKANSGYRFFQDMKVETDPMKTYYGWKIVDPNGKEDTSNVATTQPILKSGRWHKVISKLRPGYYEWVYIQQK